MKIDGSQYNTARKIADYIRWYMRYYDRRIYVEPFCGFGNIYSALYNNKLKRDPECRYALSDINPFTIDIINRLWQGGDIPEILDLDKRKEIVKEVKRRYRNSEEILDPYDGYEDWEVGCSLILGSLHQNPTRGFIGEEAYKRNVQGVKERILKCPPPDKLTCCDFTDPRVMLSGKDKIIYCDFPEPTAKNIFPFGFYFDRNEFFEVAQRWGELDYIVIYSSKYFPDNGRFEIIDTMGKNGEHKLYIEKRWYVEDIYEFTKGSNRKWARPARTIQESKRKTTRAALSRNGRKRRPL